MRTVRGRTVVVPQENIDTDQIVPARFLRTTSRDGIGKALFADRPELLQGQRGEILIAGPNFGSGSSREHAPWALLEAGFRAVISAQIADIFRANALKNALVPVQIDTAWLLAHPGAEVEIDLEHLVVSYAGQSVSFTLDPFAQRCLLDDVDELGYLLSQEPHIAAYEAAREKP